MPHDKTAQSGSMYQHPLRFPAFTILRLYTRLHHLRHFRGIDIVMASSPSPCATLTTAADKMPYILERIRALDRSSELSHLYTPFIMRDSNKWAPVGHVETTLIHSTLLLCKADTGESIFQYGKFTNESGVSKDALRLNIEIQSLQNPCQEEMFERRTAALDIVTNQLISSGVISHKHSDNYPVSPFSEHDDLVTPQKLAHVNRSTAPYIGIDSVGVHLHCYVCQHQNDGCSTIKGLWLAKRASTKSHHPNFWDPTVAGGQPVNLSLYENIIKEAHEEAGVPSEWLNLDGVASETKFTDHTHDPITITTAKPDGSCLKRSLYYSFDLQVPADWTPTAVDGEVSEFKLYSVKELAEELRFGNSVRPAMRSVLLDFMIRHGLWREDDLGQLEELRNAMRNERMVLW